MGKTSWLGFLQKASFSKPYRMSTVPEAHVLTVAVEDEEPAVAKERAAAGVPLTRVEFHALDAPGNEVFYPLNTGNETVRWTVPHDSKRFQAPSSLCLTSQLLVDVC